MRLGITLARNGDTWQVKHLPSVPLAEQLTDFKAKQVAGEFSADETIIVSLNENLKRHVLKLSPVVEIEEMEESPKKKK